MALKTKWTLKPSPEGEGLIGCVHDCHLVATVEKFSSLETKQPYTDTHIIATAAHRREILCDRNEDEHTRIINQANTLNATVIARSEATWQSPGREDLLAYTDKTPLPRGISPLRSGQNTHSGRNDIIKQAHKKPSPEGEGLIGCVHDCHLGALVEKSHTIDTARCIYAPAYPPTAKVPRGKA